MLPTYRALRPLLFRLDAERAHDLALRAADAVGLLPLPRPRFHPALAQDLWGLHFGSPVGLGAGLLKNGEALPVFSRLGFGFLEVGTVTPRPQAGNPPPRLFRLPGDRALINRMGFNNAGADALAGRIVRRSAVPLWVNIGKNRDTPPEAAADDYRALVRRFAPLASGLVVNVSSPNTPGLRNLQGAAELGALLRAVLAEAEASRVRALHPARPVLVKLSPDMAGDDFLAALEAAENAGASGVILTNTTLSRPDLRGPHHEQAGGLSGLPLRARSLAHVRLAAAHTRLPVVAVGGIFSARDAYAAILAGASLVEVYTALVYDGPGLPGALNSGLLRLLQADGFACVSEAVGQGR